MNSAHVPLGMAIVGVTVGFFGLRYFTRQKQGEFRLWGWAGLGVLFLAELSLLLGVRWVAIYFTPLCWTAYLLIIDAAVASLKGWSRLARAPRGFFILALASIPLWLIFEAYNLRMQNWTYVGLPANVMARNLGYAWSFATIWPAIFETADFVRCLGFFEKPARPRHRFKPVTLVITAFLGFLFLTIPVLVPAGLGRYLFGPVWAGFVLLLDPLNYRWGAHSFLRDWEKGESSTLGSFLAAGFICGILWEFWNYWATARWIYIFPIMQGWKIFEMPLAGYLGFPAFALGCFTMYEFLKILGRRLGQLRHGKEMAQYYPSSKASKS
jgi:hypothetical protein